MQCNIGGPVALQCLVLCVAYRNGNAQRLFVLERINFETDQFHTIIPLNRDRYCVRNEPLTSGSRKFLQSSRSISLFNNPCGHSRTKPHSSLCSPFLHLPRPSPAPLQPSSFEITPHGHPPPATIPVSVPERFAVVESETRFTPMGQ